MCEMYPNVFQYNIEDKFDVLVQCNVINGILLEGGPENDILRQRKKFQEQCYVQDHAELDDKFTLIVIERFDPPSKVFQKLLFQL